MALKSEKDQRERQIFCNYPLSVYEYWVEKVPILTLENFIPEKKKTQS